ncbi:MAG TPA: DUF6164 family protein [Gammaproteobacteria bacterium]|nr:DUF6164 family protein [Gammaproteobacteria bacterium]
MAVLLFRMRGAPADEVEEVRALLQARGIEFYETQAGFWGVGTEAIWLRDNARLAEARALLDDYQAQRAQRVRGEYEAVRASKARGLFQALRANPLPALIILLFLLFILYISLAPFLNMRNWL